MSSFQTDGERFRRRYVPSRMVTAVIRPTIERIMQIGKKKLVLDHLIVQKMDDEEDAAENVQSILTYGAQALFDEDQDSKDITCRYRYVFCINA